MTAADRLRALAAQPGSVLLLYLLEHKEEARELMVLAADMADALAEHVRKQDAWNTWDKAQGIPIECDCDACATSRTLLSRFEQLTRTEETQT